jgi:hypothetical protein
MVDPNTAATLTVDQIWKLCDDLTAAHGELLPPALRSRLDVAAGAAPPSSEISPTKEYRP